MFTKCSQNVYTKFTSNLININYIFCKNAFIIKITQNKFIKCKKNILNDDTEQMVIENDQVKESRENQDILKKMKILYIGILQNVNKIINKIVVLIYFDILKYYRNILFYLGENIQYYFFLKNEKFFKYNRKIRKFRKNKTPYFSYQLDTSYIIIIKIHKFYNIKIINFVNFYKNMIFHFSIYENNHIF
jgi:hypothetical protein